MANPTYLMKRNGIYYARIPIPKMLQNELGRKELWKSLGNRSYKEACKLLKEALLSETLLMVHAKQETELLRSPSAMRAIGQRQFEVERQRLARQYLSYQQQFTKDGVDPEIRDVNLNALTNEWKERVIEVQSDLEKGNFKPYEEMLSTRLHSTRFHPPERSNRLYAETMTQLLMGQVKAIRLVMKDITSGEYLNYVNEETTPYPASMLSGVNMPTTSNTISEKSTASAHHKISLSKLIDMFNSSAEIKKRSEDVRVKDINYQIVLLDVLGAETDIYTIKRPMVRDKLLPVLDHLPAGYRKKSEYKGMTALQVALQEQKKPSKHSKLAPTSKNDYLEHLAHLMKWAADEGFEIANPTARLSYKDDVKAKEKRDPLSADAINAFLKDTEVLAAKSSITVAHKFWVPLISLTTGMRISEIVQLASSDIKEEKHKEGNIPYFDLMEREGRSLKTKTSIRKVPIPVTLDGIGFASYVHKIRKDPKADGHLFPYIAIGDRRPGGPFSQWFSRKLKALDIKTSKVSFHSLRHSFRDFIREAVLPPEEMQIALSMTGWESNEVHARYGGKDYPLRTAQQVINKIELVGINLKHLKA